jgi:uncharacterized protein YceK
MKKETRNIVGQARILALLLCMLLCVGCGTLITRGGAAGGGPICGAYPYYAVFFDGGFMYGDLAHGSDPLGDKALDCMLASPICVVDFVADTLLLPFDLIFWAFGYHKNASLT